MSFGYSMKNLFFRSARVFGHEQQYELVKRLNTTEKRTRNTSTLSMLNGAKFQSVVEQFISRTGGIVAMWI